MKSLFSLALLLCAPALAGPAVPVAITLPSQKTSPPDIASALPGELSKTGAKAGVFVFISRQCPVSNSYAPEIERIYKTYAPKGVQMRLIYEDAGAVMGDIKAHEAQYHLTAPVYLDDRHTLSKALHATVTPEVIVFIPGRVVYQGRIDNKYADFGKVRPQATTHELRDALDAVLAGKPVPHPVTKAIGCFL